MNHINWYLSALYKNYRHYILLAVGAMNDLMELKMSFPMYHFMEPLL